VTASADVPFHTSDVLVHPSLQKSSAVWPDIPGLADILADTGLFPAHAARRPPLWAAESRSCQLHYAHKPLLRLVEIAVIDLNIARPIQALDVVRVERERFLRRLKRSDRR
jgi:hypothetical protein